MSIGTAEICDEHGMVHTEVEIIADRLVMNQDGGVLEFKFSDTIQLSKEYPIIKLRLRDDRLEHDGRTSGMLKKTKQA